ncbi:MAG: FtsQ-type POTRA domain-containing protein [Candidatus Omnitrophica bacterium]|nr:FtsQ-type POTRA domain-containing protein [Candidatus Omnitrophota bacterium]
MRRYKKNKNQIKKKVFVLNVKQAAQAIKKNSGGFLIFITVVGAVVFLGFSLNNFIFASPYFEISEIEVIDHDVDKIDYPLARIKDNLNIIKVDLPGIAKSIEREYADIQKAQVKRVLPNKLIIEVLRRRPVAQIAVPVNKKSQNNTNFFTVNNEGFILANIGSNPSRKLARINGVETAINEIEIGRSYFKTNLESALVLLEIFSRDEFFEQYKITQIDIESPANMAFFINNQLEVKIGNRNLQKRIEKLAVILRNEKIDLTKGYYIDLRFNDFVFGKK